jgi:HAD superfamily hydrolase (TIGR01509 family)
MNPRIIFDLSEVLIYGLVGVEKSLSAALPLTENEILQCFVRQLEEICRGEITEDEFLQQLLTQQSWDMPLDILKKSIRDNFQREVEGTRAILTHLAKKYDVILLSDHAREWVTYIQSIHPFLCEFKQTFFSYELGKTKKDPRTFEEVLKKMSWLANECWLIDDSPKNIEVAASVGINGIQFESAKQLQEQLISQSLW